MLLIITMAGSKCLFSTSTKLIVQSSLPINELKELY